MTIFCQIAADCCGYIDNHLCSRISCQTVPLYNFPTAERNTLPPLVSPWPDMNVEQMFMCITVLCTPI